jgi:hypothetical protein
MNGVWRRLAAAAGHRKRTATICSVGRPPAYTVCGNSIKCMKSIGNIVNLHISCCRIAALPCFMAVGGGGGCPPHKAHTIVPCFTGLTRKTRVVKGPLKPVTKKIAHELNPLAIGVSKSVVLGSQTTSLFRLIRKIKGLCRVTGARHRYYSHCK